MLLLISWFNNFLFLVHFLCFVVEVLQDSFFFCLFLSFCLRVFLIEALSNESKSVENDENSVIDVIDLRRWCFLLTLKDSLSLKKDFSFCLAFQINCMMTTTFLRFSRIYEMTTSLIIFHSSSSSIFDIKSATVSTHLIVINEFCRTMLYFFALIFCFIFLMTMMLKFWYENLSDVLMPE